MSTITKEFTKEQLQQIIETDHVQCGEASALARIALASLEAEPVAYIRSAHNPDGFCFADGIHPTHRHQRLPLSTLQDGCYWKVTPLYTAQPAPVSVPAELANDIDSDDYPLLWSYNNGWNAFRAAMLQGGNHTEQHLDMVDHSGDANEKVDYRLPFDQWLSQKNEPIDVDCGCVTTEAFYHWLRVAYEAGNSPVAPDGYVVVPKRLTAENFAKAALSGEFSETKFINCPECFGDDECETCDGSGRIEITVPVTWTTIKAIWAKGVEHFAAAPQQET